MDAEAWREGEGTRGLGLGCICTELYGGVMETGQKLGGCLSPPRSSHSLTQTLHEE